MLKIAKLKTENATCPVTDEIQPSFTFALESDRPSTFLSKAQFSINGWETQVREHFAYYCGPTLLPRTRYTVHLCVEDNHGEVAQAEAEFETGKLNEAWIGQWISHPGYRFQEKKISPRPMRFRKGFQAHGTVRQARLYCSALGIYVCELNGARIGEDFFAPGFTSYHHQIQYQTYDVTGLLKGDNTLIATVAGGWAVGSYTYFRRNRVYAKRQAFLAELHITYEDGSHEVIATDASWQVTLDGCLKAADLYDGEVYDARETSEAWESAVEEQLRFTPRLIADYGAPVQVYERREPVSVTTAPSGTLIYDFGQNFAGVVEFTVQGRPGQVVELRHAEILMNGELFTEPLRTAKQQIIYTCKGGGETYSPRFTYMGFRYVGVTGIDADCIRLTALGLSSGMERTGSFECSDARFNRMNENIYYGTRSNFVDIPTDCPQRDERLGWTGDIALFSSTASYNFDTSRFYDKWLQDVRSEQGRGGGLPMVVPSVKIYNQWEMCFPHAVDHWGDVCILTPWAEYLARGDKRVLQKNYGTMKRYFNACQWWASLFSAGEKKYVWKLFHHYGDWCAPDTNFPGWMKRGQWTATACMANSAGLLSRIAEILGKEEDAAHYKELSSRIGKAYRDMFLDQELKLKNEFQTGYVLPIYYKLFDETDRAVMARHLARLVEEQGISTGFPGTPYLLFALADNGQRETAFRTLLSETCPSWLYEVKAGGTTFWERWDALREDGTCNQGDGDGMVSFNHYAPGAVGDFLYRRIAGIEAIEEGYKVFKVEPVMGGGLTFAKGEIETPYGRIVSRWIIEGDRFKISVTVPVSTTCQLKMPNGETHLLESGGHCFEQDI